jgi:hypothetical protein
VDRVLFLPLLAGVLLVGCAWEHSLSEADPYAKVIGRVFRTDRRWFLVEGARFHRLVGERTDGLLPQYHPTFLEFEQGRWRNHSASLKFVAVVPAGTAVTVVDVKRVSNLETGRDILWLGRLDFRVAGAKARLVELNNLLPGADLAPARGQLPLPHN